MASFQFDLVSPEKLVFSGAVEHVVVPGAEGEFGVMAGHSPLVALLKPGILTIMNGAQPQRIVLGGGFAEVNPSGMTILAELAVPLESFDVATLASHIKDLEEDLADSKDDATKRKLEERLGHLRALREALGAGPAAH